MQRIGALVVGLSSTLMILAVLIQLPEVWNSQWTAEAVAAGLFAIGLTILFVPVGIVHGVAVFYPRLVLSRKANIVSQHDLVREHFADGIKYSYRVMGWIASLGICALLAYFGYIWVKAQILALMSP